MKCPNCSNEMDTGHLIAGELGVRFVKDIPLFRVAGGIQIVGKGWSPTHTPAHICEECKLIIYK